MNQGVIHPSIFMKIQTQHIPQVSTPKGQSGAFPYLKGSLHSLHPTTSDPRRASSSVLPISPVVVEAPLEKGNDVFSIQKGLAFRMIWAPFERVTFLMQCQNEIIKTGQLSNPYNGIINCVARTVRNEGIFSLWRGNTACILEFLSYKALNTAGGYYLLNKQDKEDFLKRFARNVVMTCFAINAFHYLFYPLKYARIRLATDMSNNTSGKVSERQFNGLIDVWRRTIKTDGIVGLYRGSSISYVHTLLQHALYTGISGPMLMLLKFFGLQLDSWWHFTALGTATSVLVVTYPLDTVHHRMVMRSGEAIKYKSSFHAFSQILKTEGVGSLYKGATAQILKNIVFLCLVLRKFFKRRKEIRKVVLFIDEDCLFLSPAVLLGGLQKFVDPWASPRCLVAGDLGLLGCIL
ncbi:hypothetical protein Pint_07585 [Pistacia integerrima]|uniref:Uncharacterized protein n=1 Tax=Pistacia integerrima TaxID=434235 RepID=A0ACC0XU93_9ROSI|nr:hypothetical protein Pint_07585 [Pistacia integerrima]